MPTRKFCWLTATTVALAASTVTSFSEEAAYYGQLEEVIVTAQKRERSFKEPAASSEAACR